MRRTDMALVGGLTVLITFVVVAIVRDPVRPVATPVAAPLAQPSAPAPTSTGDVRIVPATTPPPVRDVPAVRAHIAARAPGTYIGEILAARDSNIARWRDRLAEPIRVWIDARTPFTASDPQLGFEVRRAFSDWGHAGPPLAFSYVDDSARAEVRVTFVERFDGGMSGRTRWARDTHWWITRGDIELALLSTTGARLPTQQVYGIALHEIGHLLGLDHTTDTLAIMAPRIRVTALSPADVATMRLIYEVPPGGYRGH